MAKVISVARLGKVATAGVLVVAGAAVNRLFRPFGTSVLRAESMVDSSVLVFPVPPSAGLDAVAVAPVGAVPAVPAVPAIHPGYPAQAVRPITPARPTRPARPARPASAALTSQGGSRKAWRCV